jgi:hypothetical protein
MSTVWQQIRSAIDTRLKAILVTNGYQTDAGKNVYYWRTASFAQDEEGNMPELPGIKYYELTEKNIAEAFPLRQNIVTLNVECIASGSDDATVKGIVDQVYQDVMKAIGTDETWGGKAILTDKVGHEVKMDREEILVGAIIATFEVTYRHARWDLTVQM